jgi:hypothetical protein
LEIELFLNDVAFTIDEHEKWDAVVPFYRYIGTAIVCRPDVSVFVDKRKLALLDDALPVWKGRR